MSSLHFAIFSAVAAWLIYSIIYRLYLHPLSRVPGPWLAKLTRLWLIWQVRKGKSNVFMPLLHKTYGPIVRIAPDQVLCCSEEAIRKAYSAGTTFTKSDWYQVAAAPDKHARGENHLDLLTEMNKDRYRRQKRAIGPAYSIAGLEKHEEILSTYIEQYIAKLHTIDGRKVNLPEWTHIYALDALSWFTFSKSLNYTEQGNDGGNIAASESVWSCFTMVGMFPWLVKAMHTIPKVGPLLMLPAVLVMGLGIPKMWPVFGFCVPSIMERISKMDSMRGATLPANRPGLVLDQDTRGAIESSENEGDGNDGKEKDLLATLMRLHHNKEAQFNPSWVLGIAITNFGAGHDTIMHTLAVCIYTLGNHPGVVAELRKSMAQHEITKTSSYSEIVNKVPLYLAVLKESLRMYPPLGFYMPRVVPETGATVSGVYLPPKTTLGINLWATHHDPALFANPSEFQPDRWIPDGTEEKRKLIGRMEPFWMAFGGQSRSCPGQYLGRFFVVKVLARLVQEFDFELIGTAEFGGWFAVLMSGTAIRFLERDT